MEWFYAEGTERRGPITETEFDELVRNGRIAMTTQVWREGWENWRPWGEARGDVQSDGTARCVNCGTAFPVSEMVQYGAAYVCPTCKPVFFQKVKEGIEPGVDLEYGGFWIRFVAKFVDSIIVALPGYVIQFATRSMAQDPKTIWVYLGITWLIGLTIRFCYSVGLTGKYGATLGKMACGLRVVTADGGPIGYPRAAGRFFAEILSGILLCIGYIMAAFDEEKRALHDRICDTRVIRRRG